MKKNDSKPTSKWSRFFQTLSLSLALFVLSIGLAQAQDTVQIGSGEQTVSFFPNFYLYNYSYTQTIYTAEQIQASGGIAGSISKILYKPNSGESTSDWKDWKVYIGLTDKEGFTNTTDWIPISELTLVFDGQLPEVLDSGQWMEIAFSTPFEWDGTSNIVIAVDENTDGFGNSPDWSGFTTTPSADTIKSGIYQYSDSENADPTTPPEASDITNEVAQIQFYGNLLADCTGTPSIDSTTPDFDICAGTGFSVSATGVTAPANGIEYIWQSSPAGQNTWTDIEGATNTSLEITEGLTQATDYRFKVSCTISGENATSDIISVSLSPGTECYCIPEGSQNNSDEMVNFTLSNLNNTSAPSEGTDGYANYTDSIAPAELIISEAYTASITGGYGSGNHGAAIWIDYNDNGIFESTEKVITLPAEIGSDQTVELPPFTVADYPGTHRLRVQYHYSKDGSELAPCITTSPYSETEDYLVSIPELEPCTGAPIAGTVAEDFSICTGSSFTITVTGASEPAGGLDRKWQYSPAGQNTWADLPNATATSFTVEEGITEATDYRYVVLCNATNESDTSATISVTLKPASECYCIPTFLTGCSSGDAINTVILNGESVNLNNETDCSPESYSDYTTLANPDLAPGSTYTLTVGTNYTSPTSEHVKAWIDYNKNGLFEETELLGASGADGLNGEGGSEDFDFIVPQELAAGSYRMRIRLVYSFIGNEEFDGCTSGLGYGETEDYNVQIIQLEECTGTPTAGTIEAPTFAVCSGDAFTLQVTGSSAPASGLVKTWQSSPAGENTWTDISESTTSSYTVEEGINEPMDYRYKITCTNSGETSISDVISVTLNPATECYCIPEEGDYEDYYISNVSTDGALGNINNSSEYDNGYGDYTSMHILTYPGQEFDFSISIPQEDYSYTYAVWIDLNLNGSFTDPGEKVISSTTQPPFTGTITVPEDLALGTYRVRIQNNYIGNLNDPCATLNYGETEDYTLEVIEAPSCLPPTDIVVNQITSNSASLSWTANSQETSWELVYGLTGFDINTEGTSLTVNDTPSQVVTGLDSNTSYDIYVRAICSDTDQSYYYGPTNLITSCEPTDIPFIQDFEGITPPELPDCATTENVGSGNNWEIYSISGTGFIGNVIRVRYSTNAIDAWYYTQGINMEAGVNYQISYTYGANSSFYVEKLKVAIGTSPSYLDMNTVLADYPEITTDGGQNDTIVFTVPQDGVYYFGFNAYSEPNQLYVLVDNIHIDFGPACPKATNVHFQYITENSAQVVWSPGANDTSWTVTYGPTGFDPTTEGNSIEVNGGEAIATIEGLESDTTYDVYIQSTCNTGDLSEQEGPHSFTTNPTPPSNNYLCGAIDLAVDQGCVGGPFTNVNAFEQAGEPTGTCLNDFHGTNSVWFTFTAPETGTVIISTDFSQTEFVTEIVAFESPQDCEDITSLGAQLGCSTAGESLQIENLTPGETYYFKIAGFNQTEGTFCAQVNSTFGINEQQFDTFSYYPNPVESILNLSAQTPIESVKLYNLLGQLITELHPNTTDTKVNAENLQAGVYLLRVKLNGVSKTFRIVKK